MDIIQEGFGWGFFVVRIFSFWEVFEVVLDGEGGVWVLFVFLFPYKIS